jgi:hypothetical protein
MSELWTEAQARWVFQSAATLAAVGAEPVGPLVLPTSEFFPDAFDGRPSSFGALFVRMMRHVGLGEVEAEVVLVDPEAGRVVSSCSGGSCGTGGVTLLAGQRVAETTSNDGGSAYVVQLATTEVANPTVLTTVLASAVGQLFLREVDVLKRFPAPARTAAGDLAAAMLGLAVLTANGSGIEVKGCGGMKVHAATALTSGQAALALALVLERQRLRGKATPAALAFSTHLDAVARGALGPAIDLVRANLDVVRRVDDAPEGIERGDFRLREPGGGIGA